MLVLSSHLNTYKVRDKLIYSIFIRIPDTLQKMTAQSLHFTKKCLSSLFYINKAECDILF